MEWLLFFIFPIVTTRRITFSHTLMNCLLKVRQSSSTPAEAVTPAMLFNKVPFVS